ncbi:MAG: hypothetical protein KBS59_05005, partial [Clostridiales bacterium]|nr:hypothetical protein [Clostridiales bacterium]
MYFPEDEEKTENGENVSETPEKETEIAPETNPENEAQSGADSETSENSATEPETPDFDEPEETDAEPENNGDESFDGAKSEETSDFAFEAEPDMSNGEDDTGIGEAPMDMPAKKTNEPFIL